MPRAKAHERHERPCVSAGAPLAPRLFSGENTRTQRDSLKRLTTGKEMNRLNTQREALDLPRPAAGQSQRRKGGPWLRALADHVARQGEQFPEAALLVLVDIDGTLLDLRHGVQAILADFDRRHPGQALSELPIERLPNDERSLRALFEAHEVDHCERERLLVAFERLCWSPEAVSATQQPFLGVLEMLRWLRMQPGVFVALNSSRPESRREETVQALLTLSRRFGLRFSEDLLFLRGEPTRPAEPYRSKVQGVQHYRRLGYKVVAVLDDDSEALAAIGREASAPELLLVQAGDLAAALPDSVAGGNSASTTPAEICWRGPMAGPAFERFLGTCAPSAWVPVRRGSAGEVAVLSDEGSPVFEDLLGSFAQCGKGLWIEFKEGGSVLSRVVHTLQRSQFPEEHAVFVASPEKLGEIGYARLAEACPDAVRAATGHFLSTLSEVAPDLARESLERLRSWGVQRIVVAFDDPHREALVALVREAGLELALDAGLGLTPFLASTGCLPQAVVSDFGHDQ